MNEIEPKKHKALYTAGDAILYCIGDRAFPGIVISSRYKSGMLFLASGWEYIITCGGLTYKVQEQDLWPHQYRNDITCPFAPIKKKSSLVNSSTSTDASSRQKVKPSEKNAVSSEDLSKTDEDGSNR